MGRLDLLQQWRRAGLSPVVQDVVVLWFLRFGRAVVLGETSLASHQSEATQGCDYQQVRVRTPDPTAIVAVGLHVVLCG